MAYTSITFKNPNTGAIKEAPVGFSWTVTFFGAFPPLIRGDYKWAFIMVILTLLTFGLSYFVFIFIYNKLYIKDLIRAGFRAESIESGDMAYAESKMGIEILRI